jgi:hypothetical protein
MKLFECQHCQQLLYFENVQCVRCGRRLGYLSDAVTMSALEPEGEAWKALADGKTYRFCANAEHGACNWLVAADSDQVFCAACKHNRTIPDLGVPENLSRWQRLESA